MPFIPPNFTKEFSGPIVIIGFGSIGRAVLPLLSRHIAHTYKQPITIICPDESNLSVAKEYGAKFVTKAVTSENYKTLLSEFIGNDKPRGFIIQVANEVSSKALIEYAAQNNAHYIDTVVEPWPGFYFNQERSKAEQSNYALREDLHTLKPALQGAPTALSCCGANPGMVSWFIKTALLNLAHDLEIETNIPASQAEWAKLMQTLGIKGVHIAERDTQQPILDRKENEFVNTWSVSGFIAEGLQPAELGWGTHELVLPKDGHEHHAGSRSAIYLDNPGIAVRVKTWTPGSGEHFGFLITHNEAISIADYYTLKNGEDILYRPTCHYAYRPTEATVESVEELLRHGNKLSQSQRLLSIDEVTGGADELGVLLYGHSKGAYWYGSTLTVEETRRLAPHQNPTGLQVSSAIIAGFYYILENPELGLIETDETDYRYCLSIQEPYLGKLAGYYTDWLPTRDKEEAWQFNNIRINDSL